MNEQDQTKGNEDTRQSEALSDAELDSVAGGGLRDLLRSDTGGYDPRNPARTADGDPRRKLLQRLKD